LDFPYLTLIIFTPVLGALVIAFWPRLTSSTVRWLSLIATAIPLVLSLIIFAVFNRSAEMAGTIQFEELASWIPMINANYHVGIDGLSMPMMLLTTLLGVLVILISWKIDLRVKEYFIWILILQASITGVFVSLDFLLFFIFWEVELIPMYFLISIWGAGRRAYSAMKYVLYTLLGGAFILAGILILYFNTGSLSMVELLGMDMAAAVTTIPVMLTFVFFFLGFAIKLPMFPFHTWLPDAHTDAPTAVSVILAGTLLKMGGYAMLRINVGMFPEEAQTLAPLLLGLAVVNVIYGGAVTLMQTDIKRLIAYSSISHMGFVLLGIFALSDLSMVGASMQMFSHGIITGLLFAITGVLMHNTHERSIPKLGGLAKQMPVVSIVFILGGLGAMAVPATSGFVAEVMAFLGAFSSGIVDNVEIFTLLCMLGILLAAAYILWTVQRVFLGPKLEKFNGVADADKLEKTWAFVLIAIMFLIGLAPTILTDVFESGIAPLAALFGG
jgi:NADH-quinone oxidoreductase subunit M